MSDEFTRQVEINIFTRPGNINLHAFMHVSCLARTLMDPETTIGTFLEVDGSEMPFPEL
jgi:hypothetical protein